MELLLVRFVKGIGVMAGMAAMCTAWGNPEGAMSSISTNIMQKIYQYVAPALYHSGLADRYLDIGEYDNALREYMCALKFGIRSASIHSKLSRIYGETGDYGKSLAESKLAVMLNPSNATFRLSYGFALTLNRDYDTAQNEIRKAMNMNQEAHILGYLLLARINIRKMQFLAANKDIESAIALKPKSWWDYYTIAGLYIEMHDWDSAIIASLDAIKLNNTCVLPYIQAHDAMLQSGREQEAINIIVEYMKICPSDNSVDYMISGNSGDTLPILSGDTPVTR